MRKILFISLAFFSAIFYLAQPCFGQIENPQAKTMKLTNSTELEVAQFFASPQYTQDWNQDLIQTAGESSWGPEETLTLPLLVEKSELWDFCLLDEEGNRYQWSQEISEKSQQAELKELPAGFRLVWY